MTQKWEKALKKTGKYTLYFIGAAVTGFGIVIALPLAKGALIQIFEAVERSSDPNKKVNEPDTHEAP